MSASPQFNSAEPLRLLYGFSRYDAPILDVKTRGVKSTYIALQAARSTLKNAGSADGAPYCMYLAWRQGRSRQFHVGEFRKDRLGRIRFVDGWDDGSGRKRILTKDPFKHG